MEQSPVSADDHVKMRITVIMPAYNSERFIEKAILSVLAQTLTDFKLLIVNDGSTDLTSSIANHHAQRDSRITVYSTENRGVAAAMNYGLQLADTEFIAVMHADDVMYPNRLERQLAFMDEHPTLTFASSLVNHIDETGRVIGKDNSKFTTHAEVEAQIARNEPLGFNHPAVIFKRAPLFLLAACSDA